MGQVYLCEDTLDGGRQVALKRLRQALTGEGGEERLKQEFRAMVRLRHPNLARVYDYGVLDDGGEPFLTLEYLDGKDLAAQEPAEIRPHLGELMAQLCRALDYIHARGLLHNDIKPQNIFLLPLPESAEGPPFLVKLMDFGLVRFLDQEEPDSRGGTLHYAPPEALAGGRLDARSDLYSLGVVLYRLATGSLPFTQRDPVALIRAQREAIPASPRSLDATLPAGLDRLILWLLEKNPDDRPRDAAALLRALNEALGTRHALETRETRDSYLTSAALVGREREMQALRSALSRLTAPPAEEEDFPVPRLILIGGESGVGKSRLLREFRTQSQTEGVLFLSGACFESGASVYQPFVEAFRFLSPVLRDSPGTSEADSRAVLAPLFPDLEAGSSSAGALSAREAKSRLFEAIERLLREQSLKRPFVLALEDLHWADELTIELLRALRERDPGAPYLVVGTYRDDELEGKPVAPLAREVSTGARQSILRLHRLDVAEIGSLIQSMMSLQEDPADLALILQRQTAGNPLFIEEILKALAEEDAVTRRDGEWDVDLAHLDRLEVPRSINETLTRRLARLSEAQRGLVRVLSVFNRPVSRALLGRAGGWDADRLSAEIPPLLHRGILRRTHEAGEEKLGFAHSRARDLVYRSLGTERVPLHLTAGRLLQEKAGAGAEEMLEEIAYHFLQAGSKSQALEYAEKAGDKCARLFAFTAALHFYRKALELLPRKEARRRMTLFARLARLHAGASDFAEMHDYSERALRLARSLQDPKEEGQILATMAHGHLLQGHLDQAVRSARAALALLEPLGDQLGIGRAKNFLGTAYGRMGQLEEAVPYFTQALEHLEAAGDGWQVVTVKTNLGTVQSSLNRPEVSLQLYGEALEAWRRLGDRRGVAMTLGNMAQALKDLGRLEEAGERADESAALYRSTPDRTTLAVVLSSLAEIELARCRYDRTARLAEEALEIRKQIGDTSLQPLSLDLLGTARRRLGDPAGAWDAHQEGLRIAREGSHELQEGFLLLALARDALEEGKHREALPGGEKSLVLARRLKNRRLQLGSLEALLDAFLGTGQLREASGRAREMEDLLGGNGSVEERLRCSAAVGRCRLAEGRLDEASVCLERAIGLAQNLARRDQEADLRMAQSEWMEKSDRPERRAALLREVERLHREIASRLEDSSARRRYLATGSRQQVRERLASLEGGEDRPMGTGARRVPPVKMLATLYEITQIVSTLKDLTELLSRVLDLAIQIVGAERGLIFLREGEAGELKVRVARNLDQETIRDAGEYSRRILEEAAGGKPIVTLDAGADRRFERFDSVSLYNIRSLVCVPLRIRERILGTVYLDSRRGDVLFGEEDLEFLEAFANQAAVAIENARLVEALRQENLYLKQTVQNRFGFRNIIGSSPALIAALERVEKVADTALPVIIQGESGTGKELIARAIHFNSRRKDKRFLTENVAALPENLLESELFGHVRGAFTGADQDKLGLFELADGGTLFLDELGEMSLPLQSKLLRAIQEGEIRPVGSGAPRKVDVRIVAATNRDLKAMVADRSFREDLFYRLNVVTVTLPPLRQRKEDLPLLIDHFLEKIAGEKGSRPLRIDPHVLSVLSRHPWPGNIRELENTLARLALFAEGPSLTLSDLARDPELLDRVADLPGGKKAPESTLSRSELRRALKAAAGNRSQAAALLGISRATLFRKMRTLRVKE